MMQHSQKVDFDGLQVLSHSLSISAKNMGDILQEMDEQLMPLRSQWTGEAADAYQVAKAKWTGQMRDMTAFLATISRAVEHSKSKFSGAEDGFVKQL
jgi:WXG100 family type VII secretion target